MTCDGQPVTGVVPCSRPGFVWTSSWLAWSGVLQPGEASELRVKWLALRYSDLPSVGHHPLIAMLTRKP